MKMVIIITQRNKSYKLLKAYNAVFVYPESRSLRVVNANSGLLLVFFLLSKLKIVVPACGLGFIIFLTISRGFLQDIRTECPSNCCSLI